MLISPKEAYEKYKNGGARFIDVRTPAEFRSIHVEGAQNHELSKLTEKYIDEHILAGNPHDTLMLLCKSGRRASNAAELFHKKNIQNVMVVEGGTDLWEKMGLPVEKGTSVISLERQVRITAGTLILLGTMLGAFVNSYLLIVPVFVGAGLVFAGITDTCGMSLLLARMPWNK